MLLGVAVFRGPPDLTGVACEERLPSRVRGGVIGASTGMTVFFAMSSGSKLAAAALIDLLARGNCAMRWRKFHVACIHVAQAVAATRITCT